MIRLSRRDALMGLGGALGLAGVARAQGALPRIRLDDDSVLAQGGWARGVVEPAGVRLSLGDTPVPVAADGRFLVGFDRDAPAMVLLRAELGGAFSQSLLTIAPGAWEIETVDAPFHPPALSDEAFARLRAAEIARIDAARAHDTGATGWRQRFAWPLRGRVSGRFGAQRTYRGGVAGSYHSGVDIAGGEGTPYAAPAAGVVVLAAAQPLTLEGRLLMLDHGMGLNSAFLHNSALLVSEGDTVAQGQPIARIGQTGRATGPHLHWSLRWHEARLDPMRFTGPMG